MQYNNIKTIIWHLNLQLKFLYYFNQTHLVEMHNNLKLNQAKQKLIRKNKQSSYYLSLSLSKIVTELDFQGNRLSKTVVQELNIKNKVKATWNFVIQAVKRVILGLSVAKVIIISIFRIGISSTGAFKISSNAYIYKC